MTADHFRRIALGMQGAVEGEHMAHPDFRANGRIFATLSADGQWGMVQLLPEQQQEFVSANPETFVPASGAWGRGGSTMVRLATVQIDALGEAMTLAWQKAVSAKKTKPGRKPARR
ncbi:MAG: MmcQ/YjbR family DNA-binding protein [Vicinamibacterales bacterium]